jgi:hypothetical protein
MDPLCSRPGSPQNRPSRTETSIDLEKLQMTAVSFGLHALLSKPCLSFELLAVLVGFPHPLGLCIWLPLGP